MENEKCGCGPYYDCGDHDTDPTRAIAKLKADRDEWRQVARDWRTREGSVRAELATARAAREQAEEMRNHWCKEYAKSQNQLATVVEQRDTALARVKTAERLLGEERLAKAAAETALASARPIIERAQHAYLKDSSAWCNIHRWLASHPAPVAAPCADVPIADPNLCTCGRRPHTKGCPYTGGYLR